MATNEAVQELLRDFFTRLIEHVDELTEDLTEAMATYRPAPDANTIAWLIWHSARVQDAQVADIAGVDQVWTSDGWVDRFGLDLPATTPDTATPPTTWPRWWSRPNCSRVLPRGARDDVGLRDDADG